MTLIDALQAQWWADALLRSSLQGGVVIVLAALALRFIRSIPAFIAAWVWRIVLLKMLAGLFIPLTVLITDRPASIPGLTDTHVRPSLALPQWIVGVSALGFAVVATMLFLDFLSVRRLRKHTHECRRSEVHASLADASARMGVRTPPAVLEGPEVDRPMLVCGVGPGDARPAIVLPSALLNEETPAAIEGMLAHELAHQRRHDLVWGWIATITTAIFFFHPLVWYAQACLRRAQDEACDALALKASKTSPSEYGRLLVRLAQGPAVKSLPEPMAAGVVESFRALRTRLIRLTNPSTPLRTVPLLAVLALCVAAAPTWQLERQPRKVDMNNLFFVQTADGKPMNIPVIIGDGPTAQVIQFGTVPAVEKSAEEASP